MRRGATILLGIFFCVVGILHFVKTDLFVSAVPSYIPYPIEMVYISGVFEVLGGMGVGLQRFRRWAGLGLIALLVAVFPANINMALHPEAFPSIPPTVLWIRLIFQPVFIVWVWYCTLKGDGITTGRRK
jgi:uncharacterized membrane protein